MMTEQEALAQSTNWFSEGGLVGYLPFEAANFLVGTRKYQFEACCCWGYTVSKVTERRKP